MDQDAFRRLLQTQRPAASPSSSSSGFTKSKANPKTVDASHPAFKPRKVKKSGSEGQYRDRAAERREGLEGDYALVEAVLEDFEKRSASQDKSTLEAQRHYLGGDATHTVLVKGLDMALLQQNRARAAMGEDTLADDESLERAFAESSQVRPKKRTREELLRELKAKRAGQSPETTITEGEQEGGKKEKSLEAEARVLEEAKRSGKFRPIGFTPIGGGEKKKKAKDGEVGGEKRKKKKRRVDDTGIMEGTQAIPVPDAKETAPIAESSKAAAPEPLPPPAPEPETEALPEDFDIFADAGDYEGIQLDSDSEGEDEPQRLKTRDPESEHDLEIAPNRKWIDTGSPEPEPEPSKPELLKSVLASSSADAPPSRVETEEKEDEGNEERPMRLVPLSSSALPSIKDFLAAEKAASGSGKWRKRKGEEGKGKGDSKEGGKKKNTDAKVDRDYKRLKSYTDKKATT